MTRTMAVAITAALLLAASACNRTKRPGASAALDDAYKAGLLTKGEYDAKRAGIAAEAAPVAAASEVAPASPRPATNETPPAKAASAAAAGATPTSATKSESPAPHVAAEDTAAAPKTKAIESAEDKEPPPTPLKGCEDEEFKSGGAKSAARFFAASPEAVHRAAVAALESLDFNIRKDTNKEIEATKKRGIGVVIGAGGERVTLAFRKQERNGIGGTSVVGETRKSFVGRLAQHTWTDAVMAQMACKLREGP